MDRTCGNVWLSFHVFTKVAWGAGTGIATFDSKGPGENGEGGGKVEGLLAGETVLWNERGQQNRCASGES